MKEARSLENGKYDGIVSTTTVVWNWKSIFSIYCVDHSTKKTWYGSYTSWIGKLNTENEAGEPFPTSIPSTFLRKRGKLGLVHRRENTFRTTINSVNQAELQTCTCSGAGCINNYFFPGLYTAF